MNVYQLDKESTLLALPHKSKVYHRENTGKIMRWDDNPDLSLEEYNWVWSEHQRLMNQNPVLGCDDY
jgi:hypothetical protein